MTEIKIIIDGVTHEYVKVTDGEYECVGCSLNEQCLSCATFCRAFGQIPTWGYTKEKEYGRFQETNTL